MSARNAQAPIAIQERTPSVPTEEQPRSLQDQIVRRVRLRAQCRVAWLRKLWWEEGLPGGDAAVTDAEIDTHLQGRDDPRSEAEWVANEPSLRPVLAELADLESAMARDRGSRLAGLTTRLGLEAAEADVLQACLALEWDRSLARVCAYIQDHAGRAYVTESLVAGLFRHGRGRVLQPGSPLLAWRVVEREFVEAGQESSLNADPLILAWLQGEDRLALPGATPSPDHTHAVPIKSWPEQETSDHLRQWLTGTRPIVISITGQPGSGRATFAHHVCQELGVGSFVLDARADGPEWQQTAVRAVRHAMLTNEAVVWRWGARAQQQLPPVPHLPRLQFLLSEPGAAVPHPDGAIHHTVELGQPSSAERRSLWAGNLPPTAAWPSTDLDWLAERYRATPGEIASVAAHGPASANEAAHLLRQSQHGTLGDLARRLATPFAMDDLIVNETVHRAIEDLVYEAQHRHAFWERPEAQRMFPHGRGLMALFNGLPGAGKTMAAQVIAAELGFDLYRIDLSTVVSKYVGETSENLSRLLSRAAAMDAVLLFDEADALFGKRTEVQDAHDRYANMDTGHLLQAIESYPGVALLATNKKGNMDPAFIRRLRYIVEFSRPDASQRYALWKRIVGGLFSDGEAERVDAGLSRLANDVEATGAEIKFAVLSAHFAAEREHSPIELRHLVHGLDRELMKSGKGISDRDKERLASHG